MRIIPPIREQDRVGAGYYQAPRGSRRHRGVDLACQKGSTVLATTPGVVTKIGYPYSPRDPARGHLRYVQVSYGALDYRYFYITSLVSVGDVIAIDTPLGVTQGLCDIYPGIIDHFHFEVKRGGTYINPEEFL